MLHYGGHWIGPFVIARILWREGWFKAGLIIASANAIDIDHLLANPIFDPNRCSIGFHALHGWQATIGFGAMLLIPRWWVRAFALGALWHLAVDLGDCMMQGL